MQITPSALDSNFTGFSLRFQAGFKARRTFWQELAMELPSRTRKEVHSFLDRIPGMRLWEGGERIYNNIVNGAYTLVNRKYEDSIEVDRDDIEDDSMGQYGPMFEMFGGAVAQWPDDMLIEVLLQGETQLCHDGQYYFDTDHPKQLVAPSTGVQANLVTGTPLTSANFSAQIAKGMELVGADGKPLGISYNKIVVPPALRRTALEIVAAETIPNAAGTASQTNVEKNSVEVMVLDRLAASAGGSDTDWYLFDTSMPLKPFMIQMRRRPIFQAFDKPSDPGVFEKSKFRYGVDGRAAAGYGLWWYARKLKAA